jgi:hypothetical protein
VSRRDELVAEYEALLHAIQSGVRMLMNYDPPERETSFVSPKHLRTGLNGVMSDHASLAKLLMFKGVITEEEYLTAINQGLREEKARWEKRIEERLGSPPGSINLA